MFRELFLQSLGFRIAQVTIFSASFLIMSGSLALAKTQVSWGGVSIDENSISNAPVAAFLLSDGSGNIDTEARKRIKERPFAKVDFLNGRDDNTEGVIFTATVLRESLQIFQDQNRSDVVYNHTYRIFINLMAFDWDVDGAMGRYIGSVPLVIDYLDAASSPHTTAQQQRIFQKMYLENSLGGSLNVFDELYNFANGMNAEGYLEKYPQITSFEFKPEAAQIFNIGAENLDDWSYMAKQFFEAQLVKSSGSVLVPSMSEERANLEFTFLFADKSQRIVLPDPYGEISVVVEQLIPVEELDGVQKSLCHMAVIRVKVTDELDDELMSLNFGRMKKSCFVTHKDNQINHKQKYHESMLILLKDIAKQFGNSVDRSWLAGFGVPSNVIPKYVDGVGKVKTELLQSYR